MGSLDIDIAVNGDARYDTLENRDGGVNRLHDLVHKLEEENYFLPKTKIGSPTGDHLNGLLTHDNKNITEQYVGNDEHLNNNELNVPANKNGQNLDERVTNNDLEIDVDLNINNHDIDGHVNNIDYEPDGHIENNGDCELEECVDEFALTNAPALDDFIFGLPEMESDESWLYESPMKCQGTPHKNYQSWMTENVSTPELLRIKGSLSEKLDVIAIESRKGRFQGLRKISQDDLLRMDPNDPRRMSTLSLDWDFDDEELATSLGDDLGPIPSPDGFDSRNLDIAPGPRRRQAWEDDLEEGDFVPKTFTLDWSDDEDPSPMDINHRSGISAQQKKNNCQSWISDQAQPRRGGSQPVARRGAPRIAYNDDNEFAAKPVGAVKPRGRMQLDLDGSYDDSDHYSNNSSPSSGYEDSGPIVPRGMKKQHLSPGVEYDESATVLRGTARRDGVSPRSSPRGSVGSIKPDVSPRASPRASPRPSPRGSTVNIVKPVQRRKPQDTVDSPSAVRPRGSNNVNNHNKVRPRTSGGGGTQTNNSDFGGSQVRPRGAANNGNHVRPRTSGGGNQSYQSNDIDLSVNNVNQVRPRTSGGGNQSYQSNDTDNAPIRRRGGGPPQTAEVAPMPRRSLDSAPRGSPDLRSQQDPPVRRSMGGLPQRSKNKSNDSIARPRQSPSGIARPRGQPAM